MSGEAESSATLPAYAISARPKRVKRIRLALLVASFAACLSVTLMGAIAAGLLQIGFGVTGLSAVGAGRNDFLEGVQMAFQLASFNFILFFITVPAAALALGLSIGRLPYRGITALKPYLRWGAIWGAVLVGITTGLVGLFAGVASAAGALFGGGSIGALAGLFCGFLVHRIINPARQLNAIDLDVF